MGDRHDYVALEWVKGEIAETLKQARQALEAFVENPQDSTRMRFCLTYVHRWTCGCYVSHVLFALVLFISASPCFDLPLSSLLHP